MARQCNGMLVMLVGGECEFKNTHCEVCHPALLPGGLRVSLSCILPFLSLLEMYAYVLSNVRAEYNLDFK